MMSVEDVAALIKKAPYTVRKMARLGTIPGGRKIGKTWRFTASRIAKFAGEKEVQS